MTVPDLTAFDPTTPAFYGRADYFAVLAALRAEAPVHRVADGLVTIARYDDIREVSRDPGRFRSSGGALVNDPIRTGSHQGQDVSRAASIRPGDDGDAAANGHGDNAGIIGHKRR